VATYTDPGGAEPNSFDPTPATIAGHYTALIGWGDSTFSAGTITYSGGIGSKTGTFTVTGTHAYAQEGIFTITMTIAHELVTTTVTSTATIKDDLGLLLLDPTGSKSLAVTGNGGVTVSGCGGVVVDSSAPTDAAVITGNGGVTAADIDVTGGTQTTSQGTFSRPVDTEAATPDPLGLALPSAPSPTFAAVNYSGSAPLTLSPGTYVGGIQITGSGPVTLLAGEYFMEGGGFSDTGQSPISGTGVVIINAPGGSSGTISITGQGSVTLSAPTSGPFMGVVMFQDPASGNSVSFTGQGPVTLTGVVYVPHAPVSVTGTGNVTINAGAGTATLPPILGALIAYDLKVTGPGGLFINPDDPPGGGASSLPAGHGPLGPVSLLPSEGQQAEGNSPLLAPVTLSGESTTGVHQTVLDELFSSKAGSTGAALSGESKGVRSAMNALRIEPPETEVMLCTF
jgi:hypothetical protein